MKQTSSVARDLSRMEKGEIRLLVEIHTEWQGPTVYVCSLKAILGQMKGKENAVREDGKFTVLESGEVGDKPPIA